MNRKERRMNKAQEKHIPMLQIGGSSYTLEQANNLAIAEYNRRNLQAAAAIYRIILAKYKEFAELYNNLGNILYELAGYDEALTNYLAAVKLNPNYAACFNNIANTFQQLGKHNDALAYYNKAITLKPEQADFYLNRAKSLRLLDKHRDAIMDYKHAITLKPDYPEAYNNIGNTLQELGQYQDSLACYDIAIKLKPDYVGAYNNRGGAFQQLKRYNESIESYDKAIELKPDYADAYNNKGTTLQEMMYYDDALSHYNKATELNPYYADAYVNQGNIYHEIKRYDEALGSYHNAIKLRPDHAEAYNNLSNTLASKGEMDEAEKMLRHALSLNKNYLTPWFRLTNIRKYSNADHPDIKNIQDLLQNPAISQRDRGFLCFSLGKVFDDCGKYDEAFEYYRQANEINNRMVSYNPDKATDITNQIIETFNHDLIKQSSAFASASKSPIFILGMPRSGTTLMASILSNHPSIKTAGELPTILDFTVHLPALLGTSTPYPQAVNELTPAAAAQMINDYEKRLRRDIEPAIPYIIDKQPLNFRYIGFISMLFPNALIIHCKRHPLDTCLSNYFQRFTQYYNYSFDLANIGHFYNEYFRLMEHWRQVLPNKMVEVSYEDMVNNTEQPTRHILDALKLEWNDRCLSPHTNPCAVETASQWQVRQPIYKQSVERWQHYEKFLTPLKEILSFN